MTRISQRIEPGRLVMRIEEIDPEDRVPVDQSALIRIDLGRETAVHPVIDVEHPAFLPVRVTYDPLGRVWTPIHGMAWGHTVELSTPLPYPDSLLPPKESP